MNYTVVLDKFGRLTRMMSGINIRKNPESLLPFEIGVYCHSFSNQCPEGFPFFTTNSILSSSSANTLSFGSNFPNQHTLLKLFCLELFHLHDYLPANNHNLFAQ